ncbi:NAD(+)/NADH kinase [Candidatus Woesearchaeota archaeon]|nr:NAD(+)/NADH kinase [Candidatus Woesearchaeota archaeon]
MHRHKKVAIVRRNNKSILSLKKEIESAGFCYDAKHPDLVISAGGDGTFFHAERKYPGIPKLLIRESGICEKCSEGNLAEILDQYRKGYLRVKQYFQLEGTIVKKNGKRIKVFACNDIIFRNKLLTRAIRFSVIINKKMIDGEIIGDGIVVATPFGAAAYFRSISHRNFSKGIGIAFNNPTQPLQSIVVKENAIIIVKLHREQAILGVDNDPRMHALSPGDHIEIKKSKKIARLIQRR